MKVRVEHIEGSEGLKALAVEWNELLAASASDSLFLRHEWITTWWDVFGERFHLAAEAARDETGRLVGLAPCMTGPGPGRLSRRLPHLMVIGQQGDTLAEHLDLIVRRDCESAVVPALLDALSTDDAPHWDVLYFERVLEASPVLVVLADHLRAKGYAPERSSAGVSPYLPLPSSFESLLSAKSRNFRKQYLNSSNRLAREGEVRFRLAGRDVSHEEAFETLVSLHRARWEGKDGSFATEAYVRFHRELSRRLLDVDACCLALLDVGAATVAARYDFVHAGKMWCFQGGWLPAYERMRVGTLLLGHVLGWAIEQGLEEYDFLSGEDPYKHRWATDERALVNLTAFAPTTRVKLYRRAVAAKETIQRWRGRSDA